jgi:hypothetical protein
LEDVAALVSLDLLFLRRSPLGQHKQSNTYACEDEKDAFSLSVYQFHGARNQQAGSEY